MHRRTLALIAAGIITAALAAGAFFLFAPRGVTFDVDPVLRRVDQDLAGGYLEAARSELAAVRVLPRSESQTLRLLKRAWLLGGAGDKSARSSTVLRAEEVGGGWGTLGALAGQALRAHPRSAEIRAVAAYASLREGNLADAERALARGVLPAEIGRFLKAEAALRRGRAWSDADGLTRDVLGLEADDQPASYAAAALRTGDARLTLDAAVLAMGGGEVGQARSIVLSGLRQSRWNEPSALILYDAGDGDGALARLDAMRPLAPGRPDLALLRADVLSSMGRISDAQAEMESALSVQPGISWVPYANLSYLARARGDRNGARAWIERGLRAVPGSAELSLALARLEAEAGDTDSAEALLTALLKARPDFVDASLLLLSLQAPRLSPEAYRARMWKIFNAHPSDQRVLRELVSTLVAAQDWDGVSVAFRQNETAGGAPEPGTLLLQGMAAAMRGDADGAIGLFYRAAAGSRDGAARFDAALVMLRDGRAAAALGELDAALDENARAGVTDGSDAFRARVQETRAEAYLILGNPAAARAALEQARKLNPTSLRVTLLAQKLEAPLR